MLHLRDEDVHEVSGSVRLQALEMLLVMFLDQIVDGLRGVHDGGVVAQPRCDVFQPRKNVDGASNENVILQNII